MNPTAAFVHEDLAFDLSRSMAQLPPSVWDQRICDSVVFASNVGSPGAQAGVETLAMFTLRLAEAVPDEFCADVLHAQATRLCDFSSGMRAAAAFEALEDGFASPPDKIIFVKTTLMC